MSLILDALKKSERTRQQSLTGQLGAGEMPSPRTRLAVPWVTLLGLLLLVNAVVLGVLFFGGRPAAEAPPVAAASPSPAPPPPAYHPRVRPLSEEVGAPPVNVAPATPASPAPPDAAAQAPEPPQPELATNAAALPTFAALTPEQRQGLPELHLDVHGYAEKPADRFVVINLKRYRIGEVLAEGPTIRDIIPEGAVLEYHGTVFLLPAT
ncbi:MAG: general secretion pathway protein GspB [Bacillota bacterium]